MLATNLLKTRHVGRGVPVVIDVDAGGAYFGQDGGAGTESSLLRSSAMSGVSASGKLSIAFKMRWEEVNFFAALVSIGDTSAYFAFDFPLGSRRIRLLGRNSAGTEIMNASADVGFDIPDDGELHPVLVGIDLENDLVPVVYIDDSKADISATTWTDDNIDFTKTPIRIGARNNGAGFDNPFESSLRFFWMEVGQKLDYDTESNRRLFFDSDGNTKNLGSNGENPLGSDPDLYFAGELDGFETNLGTAGAFTEVNTLQAIP